MFRSACLFLCFIVVGCLPLLVSAQDDAAPAGSIIFVANTPDGEYLLMSMNPDGTDAHALTNGDLQALGPSASPDGSKIAFTDINTFDLFVINADGSQLKRLTNGGLAHNPNVTGWLPDGSAALYLSDQRELRSDFNLMEGAFSYRKEVFVAPTNGNASYVIGEIPLAIDTIGNWSPDGKWLLVTGTEAPVKENNNFVFPRGTYVASPDGTIQKIWERSTGTPAFSPDGTQVAFVDNSDLVVVPIDLTQTPPVLGEPETLIDGMTEAVSTLAWSPDGSQIVVQVWNGQADEASGGPGFIYSINVDGSDQQLLTGTGSSNATVSWTGGVGTVETVVTETTEATPVAVTPAVSPTGSTAADCMVSTATVANLRSGAGTTFAVAGVLQTGDSLAVIGEYIGSDGLTWWQVEGGLWVRADVVKTSGECEDVPQVNR